MAERFVAPLIEAYDANRELNRQTKAARRASRRFTQSMSRRGQSQRPAHAWSAHGSGHHEVMPKQGGCHDPGSEADGSA